MKQVSLLAFLFYCLSGGAQTMALDTTFGTSGYSSTWFDTMPQKGCFDGNKYYLLGTYDDYMSLGRVVCLNADGSINTGFGDGGMKQILLSGQYISMTGIKVLNGMVYIFGQTESVPAANPAAPRKGIIVRLTDTGNFDPTFGTNGIVTLTMSTEVYFGDLFFNPDSSFFVAGGGSNQMLLCKYLPNGNLDTSFNTLGYKILPSTQSANALRFFARDNGFILCGENHYNDDSGYRKSVIVLDKFDANGELTTDFGINGEIKIPIQYSVSTTIKDLEIVGNKVYSKISWATFGLSGQILQTYDMTVPQTLLSSLGLFAESYFNPLESGKILRTNGTYCYAGPSGCTVTSYVLQQYNADGTLDTGFNNAGSFNYDFPGSYSNGEEGATYVYVHDDGSIFIAGRSQPAGNPYTFMKALRIGSAALANTNFKLGQEFTVYPNPASDKLYLESTTNKAIEKINLIDISGKTIPIDFFSGNSIDISKLQKGIYFLNVFSEEKNYNLKFIKS
jgi:uncharacterized delta-60 repeat protein